MSYSHSGTGPWRTYVSSPVIVYRSSPLPMLISIEAGSTSATPPFFGSTDSATRVPLKLPAPPAPDPPAPPSSVTV